MIHKEYYLLKQKQEDLINRVNYIDNSYSYIVDRYKYPIITKEHVPIEFRYDLNEETNPYFLERLGVNSTFNSGAIYFNDEYYLIVRVEGVDRKSIFMVAKSKYPTFGFRFTDTFIDITDYDETNVYDIRLTKHDDGYIYGIFCSESKDNINDITDTVSAKAEAGIIRTKDFIHFERLNNIKSNHQQRNVLLHPHFVNGKYLLYTRPQDDFIAPGSTGGIMTTLVDDITNVFIEEEIPLDDRKYHTVYEYKNGAGAIIETKEGYIHIAHGVRNTAAGLRYVLYAFMTDLNNPRKIIYKPAGYLMAPEGIERVGDVSNVLFTNGAILKDDIIYIYYASSDTMMHVASIKLDKMLDYLKNTKKDGFKSYNSLKDRFELYEKNMKLLKGENNE